MATVIMLIIKIRSIDDVVAVTMIRAEELIPNRSIRVVILILENQGLTAAHLIALLTVILRELSIRAVIDKFDGLT